METIPKVASNINETYAFDKAEMPVQNYNNWLHTNDFLVL